eukprot:768733-Hanusia_phi.AAC.6
MQAFINSVVMFRVHLSPIVISYRTGRDNKGGRAEDRQMETHYDDAYKVDGGSNTSKASYAAMTALNQMLLTKMKSSRIVQSMCGQRDLEVPYLDQDGPNMHQDASVEYGEEDQVMEDELVVKDENEIEEIAGADICPGSPRRGEGNTLKRKAKKSSEAWKRQQVTNIPFSSYECKRYVDTGESQARGTPHAMTCNWAKGFAEGWTIAANLSAAKTLAQAAEAKQGKDEPETDPECGIFVGWQHNQLDQESLEKPSTPVKSRDELRLHREARTSTTPPIQKQTTSQETVPQVRESPATRILDLVKQAEEKFEEQYGKGSWTRKPTDSDEDSAMEDEDDDLVV